MKTVTVKQINGTTKQVPFFESEEELADHLAEKTPGTEVFQSTPSPPPPKLPPNVLSK